jgi:4-hydroxythreonine-4-phosphate dehydrogenase
MKPMSGKPDKPHILLTIGDPNGIGPEIILKIFSNKKIVSAYDLFTIGSKNVLDQYSSLLKLPNIAPDKIIDITKQRISIDPGKVHKSSGKLSGDAVKKAIELCLDGKFDAMVTLPISKEAFKKAGFDYPGHTEMLQELAGSESTLMIMYSTNLILSLITVHIPLSYVSKKVTGKTIIKKVISFNNSLVTDFNIKRPAIALLALNPHAGDGGKLGDTEIKIISPAIKKLRDAGFNIEGPFPADGFFASKAYKKFDGTIAMYHDQGLIPFKMISKDKGVNYTAGINIIRTSPNHGTGFDIAGKGIANPNSTIEAIKLAAKLIPNKN